MRHKLLALGATTLSMVASSDYSTTASPLATSASPSLGLSGVMSVGPLYGAIIQVYALNGDGSTGAVLGSATTNSAVGAGQ